MNSLFNIRSIFYKTAILTSIATLGLLSLASCSQSKVPEANLDSPASARLVTAKTESPTLKNLQKAYNGESNAHVMYQAFANKADQEGYKGVASLFRAAAAAEAIHRDNHAQVIRAMGATPQSNITNPDVKSTSENLQQAISGESYERDSMYPSFIKQAKAEGNRAAVQTLSYAKAAEAQHAQLYTEAKNNLEKLRDRTSAFNVCTASGETTKADKGAPKCPANDSDPLFKKVS
jgi:rubrerythrin